MGRHEEVGTRLLDAAHRVAAQQVGDPYRTVIIKVGRVRVITPGMLVPTPMVTIMDMDGSHDYEVGEIDGVISWGEKLSPEALDWIKSICAKLEESCE